MEKLRKVLYKPDGSDEFIELGYFHQWVISQTQCFGIIEKSDGLITLIWKDNIKFMEPPIQKVLYRKYTDAKIGNASYGFKTDFIYEGEFMDWGKSTEYVGSEVTDITDVAIIKVPNGTIVKVLLEDIKFIN